MKIILKKFACSWPHQIIVELLESKSEYVISNEILENDWRADWRNHDKYIIETYITKHGKYNIYYFISNGIKDEEYQSVVKENYSFDIIDKSNENHKLRTDKLIIKLIESSEDSYTKENFKIIEIPDDIDYHLEIGANGDEFEIVCENYRQWNKENDSNIRSTYFGVKDF